MVKIRVLHPDGTWTRVDCVLERDPKEKVPGLCLYGATGIVRIVAYTIPADGGDAKAIVQHMSNGPRQYILPTNLNDTTQIHAEAAMTYPSTLRSRPWPNVSSREGEVQVHYIPLEDLWTAIDTMAQGKMLTVLTKPPAGLHGCTKCRGAANGCHRCLDSAGGRVAYVPPTPVYVIAA